MEILNAREKLVLEAIVRNYILTTNPVASSFISKKSRLHLSPATIRNIMARLEEKGLIYQPHTSAGRVPTTLGYRLYVDNMMGRARLSRFDKEKIRQVVKQNTGDIETLLDEATRILAHLSRQLSVIISPPLEEGTFHRMDISRLNSNRLMLIISIKSGLVKTIVLEIDSKIRSEELESLRRILNERLHGLRLKQIRQKFGEIVKDIRNEETGLIRVFIETAARIFNFSHDKEVYLTGTHNILRQPEFADHEKVSGVVELLEDKNVIIHLLDKSTERESLNIAIGEEIGEQIMENCSIIAARYKIGRVAGTLGIIGPTRMDYHHLVPLVDFTAQILSEPYKDV